MLIELYRVTAYALDYFRETLMIDSASDFLFVASIIFCSSMEGKKRGWWMAGNRERAWIRSLLF